MKLGSKSRALTMLVIGTLLGAIMLSPVVAGPNDPATKKFARTVANKKATKKANAVENKLQPQINDRYTKGEANSVFQPQSGLLSATVTNAGNASAALLRGRGVVSVSGFLGTTVKFNRNVSNCVYTANYDLDSTGTDIAFATVDAGAADTVIVSLWDDTGTLIAGAGQIFHLVVVCP